MKKEIYLVDCENIGYQHLSFDGKIFYFTSGTYFMDDLEANEREIHVYHDGIKDALDFILDTKLGYLICHYGKSYKYRIVSMDKGYENIIRFWGSQGYNIDSVLLSENNNREFKSILSNSDIIKGLSSAEKSKLSNVFASWYRSKKKSKSVLKSSIDKAFSKSLSTSVRNDIVDYLYKEVVD